MMDARRSLALLASAAFLTPVFLSWRTAAPAAMTSEAAAANMQQAPGANSSSPSIAIAGEPSGDEQATADPPTPPIGEQEAAVSNPDGGAPPLVLDLDNLTASAADSGDDNSPVLEPDCGARTTKPVTGTDAFSAVPGSFPNSLLWSPYAVDSEGTAGAAVPLLLTWSPSIAGEQSLATLTSSSDSSIVNPGGGHNPDSMPINQSGSPAVWKPPPVSYESYSSNSGGAPFNYFTPSSNSVFPVVEAASLDTGQAVRPGGGGSHTFPNTGVGPLDGTFSNATAYFYIAQKLPGAWRYSNMTVGHPSGIKVG